MSPFGQMGKMQTPEILKGHVCQFHYNWHTIVNVLQFLVNYISLGFELETFVYFMFC